MKRENRNTVPLSHYQQIQQENEQFKVQLEEASGKIRQSNIQTQKLSSQLKAVGLSKSQQSDFQRQLFDTLDELQRVKEELNKAVRVEEYKELEGRYHELQQQIIVSKESFGDTIDDLVATRTHNAELQRQLDEQHNKYELEISELKELIEGQLNYLQKQDEQMSNLKFEYEQLHTQYTEREELLVYTVNEYEENMSVNTQYQTENESLQEENRQLTTHITQLEVEVERLSQVEVELRNTKDLLYGSVPKELLEDSDEKCTLLRTQLNDLKAAMTATTNEFNRMKLSTNEQENGFQKRVSELNGLLTSHQERIKMLSEMMRDSQKKREELESSYIELERERDRERENCVQLKQRTSYLEDMVNKYRNRVG
eukprot:CAMPEP_0182422354 /NCGR_PEP_ID=MMETSP1167-20130531/8016_1 /TAXON_ID=2988 /ORGANISM="Mallomonas Sp, Strain CCMP3275" /LENGTH=369 /DNA_ID=CAMNT_0024600345 /DNA_START=148 /DNA_END=1254 /DNA_ORIENTATION=+